MSVPFWLQYPPTALQAVLQSPAMHRPADALAEPETSSVHAGADAPTPRREFAASHFRPAASCASVPPAPPNTTPPGANAVAPVPPLVTASGAWNVGADANVFEPEIVCAPVRSR